MKKIDVKQKFDELMRLPHEIEFVEFKEAKTNLHFDELGKYFSALSNEANLKNQRNGWLVLGVNNSKTIVGTAYRPHRQDLDRLKHEIAEHTTNRITFSDIHELNLPQGRILLFEIPTAPQGIPIAWKGHYYGRDGESTGALNIQELEQIRARLKPDWSAQICEGAALNDLDLRAIKKARDEYKIKNPKLAFEVDKWDDASFFNKAKLTINGRITRTAILLLGMPESDHYISPGVAKISWILKDEHNRDKDYEHFGPPFILNSDAVLSKIRNLKYRYLPDNTLFPTELFQYESYVIREALHNCIAHQDYELKSRITVVEKSDELIFVNAGNFIPGTVEAVIEQDAPPSYYRNHFLAQAMVNLNMIDTVGGGIKKMFSLQRDRYFPLPTYELDNPDKVIVRIIGKILDENYTRLLIQKTDLDLKTVILLDRVQKKIKISKEAHQILKSLRLVEGRYPAVFVVSQIAEAAGNKAAYIKNRAFDNEHYKKMVMDFIKEYGSATRKEIDDLLINKLSDVLTEKQKISKINNLIYEMSKKGKVIRNKGPKKKPQWILRDN